MGSKLTKSKKKTADDVKTDSVAAPVEQDWSTSTWPRKKKPDFSDQKSGTLGRKSRFGKGSTATLGNESKLERRPSFGKRIRASARNWASTRGLYKGPKNQQGTDSESKPNNVGQEVDGEKEKVEDVSVVEVKSVADNKELDVGALVKEMVTESIIKKKLSDTSNQKVEAQIEDDGDKDDYEPVFVNHKDAATVMSEICNVEFEPTQLVETCDVIITEVNTNVEKINEKDEVNDKEEISTIENVEAVQLALSEVADVHETPEIVNISSTHATSDNVMDNNSYGVNVGTISKPLDIETKSPNEVTEHIKETAIDEDICVAVEVADASLKVEDPIDDKLTENISQDSPLNLQEAAENTIEYTHMEEAQNLTHDMEIEEHNDNSVVVEEAENATEMPSEIVDAQPNEMDTTKIKTGNEVNIPVLSEMEPHLEDLLSQRRTLIEENVPADDLERENKPSEIIMEPRLEDLMVKRQNIIEENLPSDDLERETKPFEVILEPELEDLMMKRRNIIEENAPPVDLEKEKKISEIILEPQLDDLLMKRRVIIEENQVSPAIAEIEQTIQYDEISKDESSNCAEKEIKEELHTEQETETLETVEVINEDAVNEVQDDNKEISFDENEEANLESKDEETKCLIEEKTNTEELFEDIQDENEATEIKVEKNTDMNSVEPGTDDVDTVTLNPPPMCTESCAPYYHGKFSETDKSTDEEPAIVVKDEQKLEEVEDEEVMNLPVMCTSTCAPAFHKIEKSTAEEPALVLEDEQKLEEVDDEEVMNLPAMCNSTCAPAFHKDIPEEKTDAEEVNIEEEITENVDENDTKEDADNSESATKMCTKQCAPAYHKAQSADKDVDEDNLDLVTESTMELPNKMCTQSCAPNFHTSSKTEESVDSETEKDSNSEENSVNDEVMTEEDLIKNEEDNLLEQKINDLSGIIGDTLKLVQEQMSETSDEIDEIEKFKLMDSDFSANADNHMEGSEDGSDGERTDISTDEGIVASSDEEEMCKDDKQEKEKLNKKSEEITNSVD